MVLSAYRGLRVVVTGGLGFIGSNLAIRLCELGARVRVIDALLPDCGGNRHNLAGYEDRIAISVEDIGNHAFMEGQLADCEVVFNLAGHASHLASLRDPLRDLEVNCRAQLTLLEACRSVSPGVKIIFASSRQIYGRQRRLPVDEACPIEPVDANGIHKHTAESYHFLYGLYGIRAVSLRLSNTFGPRQLVRHDLQSVLGWFMRKALEGEEIVVFGDGQQLRDPIYVDDAVTAFLLAGLAPAADGQVFNIGAEPYSLKAIAELLVTAARRGSVRLAPFPPDRLAVDIGSYYGDHRKAERVLGWKPRVPLEEGLRRTLAYYREHGKHYL